MKVSLSNGERFELSRYTKDLVDYKGDTTNAIILYLEQTTLDAVKAAFSNEDNLNTIYIYSDSGERSDFNGYQVRKSIALGEEDDTFEVTLVKATDLSLKVSAISKDVVAMTQIFNQAVTAFNDMEKASLDYAQVATKAIEQASTAETNTESAMSHAEELAGKLREAYGVIESFTNELQHTREYFREVSDKYTEVCQQYDQICAGIREVRDNTSNISNVASQMDVTFKSRIATFDSIEEESRVIRSNIDSTKTSVENTEKNVELFSKDISEFRSTVEQTTKTASTAKDTAEQSKKIAEQLDTRLTVLEPVTDITKMTFEDAKRYKIKESQIALEEWLQTHYAYFMHNGKVGQYSITNDKQTWLQAMILTSTMAASKGIDYQPSWNASGEPCTYDWTAEELQQLAFVIESIVRPRISGQQHYEKEILAATTIEELATITFNYDEFGGDVYMPDITVTPGAGTDSKVDDNTAVDETLSSDPTDSEVTDDQDIPSES